MSDLTYENTPSGALETYEWDNVWWERNNDKDHRRIMYLGDSISVGIRNAWNNVENIEWYLDNCATSKAADNPYLLPLAVSFKKQMLSCDAVLVNNGLHGWHLSIEEYSSHYKNLLCALKAEFGDTPMIIVTTTCVTNDDERNAIAVKRNEAAKALADKLSLPIIDLYPTSTELVHRDGVHLHPDGYLKLTEVILAELKNLIG